VVASEEHQVGVVVIDPERGSSSVFRISQLDASQAILVPLEVAERVIEHGRANLLRTPEIEFRAAYRLRADRKAALVRQKDGSRWHAQHQTINRCRPERQIRMSTAPIGTRDPANVCGPSLYPKSAV